MRQLFLVFLLCGLAAAQNTDFRSVLDFGAKCDGRTDDGPAIQSAIDWGRADTPTNGATIYLPRGRCLTNRTIVLKGRVDLVGQNSSASVLGAGPAFPANSAVLQIGDRAVDPQGANHAMASDFSIQCPGAGGCTGVHSELVEEDLFLYSSATATDSECIYVSGSTSSNPIRRVTCSTHLAALQPRAGVHILGATVTLSDIHCEGHADCVFFDKYGGGSAQGIYGHRTITNNVHIGPNTSGIVALGAFGNSAKVNILDDGMHQSIATIVVALYATSSNVNTPNHRPAKRARNAIPAGRRIQRFDHVVDGPAHAAQYVESGRPERRALHVGERAQL